jgi:hypothetical protein
MSLLNILKGIHLLLNNVFVNGYVGIAVMDQPEGKDPLVGDRTDSKFSSSCVTVNEHLIWGDQFC